MKKEDAWQTDGTHVGLPLFHEFHQWRSGDMMIPRSVSQTPNKRVLLRFCSPDLFDSKLFIPSSSQL